MGIKNFFMRQMLKRKLKGMPESQQEMIMAAVEKNPEFFKKIGDEVKRLTKQGQSEMSATMMVMRKYQGELRKIMQE